jgi:hypothetical protein
MAETSMPVGNRPVGIARPQLTAAQQALLERKVLSMSSLQHGAFYTGLLDDTTATAQWHAERRRFLFWEDGMQQPQPKGTPHVADLGLGPRFAPLFKQEPDGKSEVTDRSLATTR